MSIRAAVSTCPDDIRTEESAAGIRGMTVFDKTTTKHARTPPPIISGNDTDDNALNPLSVSSGMAMKEKSADMPRD